MHERVVTTKEKAKEAKSLAEKMVTLARKGTLHARRLAVSRLHDVGAVNKLFNDIAKRNTARPGGFTRILTLDRRRLGDNASQVIFEWVDKVSAEPSAEGAEAVSTSGVSGTSGKKAKGD